MDLSLSSVKLCRSSCDQIALGSYRLDMLCIFFVLRVRRREDYWSLDDDIAPCLHNTVMSYEFISFVMKSKQYPVSSLRPWHGGLVVSRW